MNRPVLAWIGLACLILAFVLAARGMTGRSTPLVVVGGVLVFFGSRRPKQG